MLLLIIVVKLDILEIVTLVTIFFAILYKDNCLHFNTIVQYNVLKR